MNKTQWGRALVFLLSVAAIEARADIERFYQVSPGIYRGDQPDTMEDYRRLQSLGVRTFINLREDETVEKERKILRGLDIDMLHFPMNAFRYPDEAQVNETLRSLTDSVRQPVFIHCQHGKDRTGLIMALHRVFYQNWKADDAYREMKKIGFAPILFNLKAYFRQQTRGR